jgi:exodeoxyribonuclease-3
MRITTWNINGIRAAHRKGLVDAIEHLDTDVLLLQEVRAMPEQIPTDLRDPDGWHVHWHPAEKPGYAGTAVLSRHPITVLHTGLSSESATDPDTEGRLIRARIEAKTPVEVACMYLPSGSSSPERQAIKDRYLVDFDPWAEPLLDHPEPLLIAGDYNVAPMEMDIFHWKSNLKSSGFLPHERAWFRRLTDAGWSDHVREAWGETEGGPYTWWSNRGQARALDRGWRIDHTLGNRAMAELVEFAEIGRDVSLTISDHAPVTVEW